MGIRAFEMHPTPGCTAEILPPFLHWRGMFYYMAQARNATPVRIAPIKVRNIKSS